MTERKPPWMRNETWVDRQVREATERGDFDNLPGAGKPLPNLDQSFTATRWAIDWVEREGGDLRGLLPPLLALRRERSELLASLGEVPTEALVRDAVADFNRRLLDQYRRPAEGPLIAVGVLDVEETVVAWHEARPAPAPIVEPTPEPRSSFWNRWRRSRRP